MINGCCSKSEILALSGRQGVRRQSLHETNHQMLWTGVPNGRDCIACSEWIILCSKLNGTVSREANGVLCSRWNGTLSREANGILCSRLNGTVSRAAHHEWNTTVVEIERHGVACTRSDLNGRVWRFRLSTQRYCANMAVLSCKSAVEGNLK